MGLRIILLFKLVLYAQKMLMLYEFLDMGAIFDYFDPISHHGVSAQLIGEKAVLHREYLLQVMQKHGFIFYEGEYWHYTYHEQERAEPLDIEINDSLRET